MSNAENPLFTAAYDAVLQLSEDERVELVLMLIQELIVPTEEEIEAAISTVTAVYYPAYLGKTGPKTTNIYSIRDLLLQKGIEEWTNGESVAALFHTRSPIATATDNIGRINSYLRRLKTKIHIQSRLGENGVVQYRFERNFDHLVRD